MLDRFLPPGRFPSNLTGHKPEYSEWISSLRRYYGESWQIWTIFYFFFNHPMVDVALRPCRAGIMSRRFENREIL